MLIDFPNVPAWEDGVLEVRQTSPGSPALGTTLVARRAYGPWKTNVDCRITDWQEGRSVTMEILGGPTARATACYAVEPLGDDACSVTYSGSGELRPLLVWLSPMVHRPRAVGWFAANLVTSQGPARGEHEGLIGSVRVRRGKVTGGVVARERHRAGERGRAARSGVGVLVFAPSLV